MNPTIYIEVDEANNAHLCAALPSTTLGQTEAPLMRLHVSNEVATGNIVGEFTIEEVASGQRIVDVPRYREVPSMLEAEARALIAVAKQTAVPCLLNGMVKRLEAALK